MAATTPLPVLDASWVIHWVRGPRTARQLGLPESWAWAIRPCCCPGRLARGGGDRSASCRISKASQRGAWAEAAAAAGITLIDPRGDPAAIIAAIGRCRVLLSEAMHGVIVADAMRVPWIALRPLAPVHRAKWHDWADTLDLRSSFTAGRLVAARSGCTPRRSPRHTRGRHLLDRCASSAAGACRGGGSSSRRRSPWPPPPRPPQLSAATALDRCRTRMLERLDALRRDPRHNAAALHPCCTSAYHG